MAWIRRLGVSAIVFVPILAAAQQPTGTISGRIVDRASQQAIIGVTVRVVGTTRAAQTGDQGTYRITGVPSGTVSVQALRIGYASATRPITMTDGGTSTLDFALDQAATQLDIVQITATGQEQSRRESGVATANINVATDVPQAAVTNMASVLSSRAPGVVVQEAGGTTGSGARVRIRGSNSVSLSNDPLIIIDGIRVNNQQDDAANSIGVGGQVPSRLNDINQEDIENIEIIKGPAAAALYGTAAANGVIQITTKRGRAGKTRWNVRSEAGTVNEVTKWPSNYAAFDVQDAAPGDTIFGCTNDFASRGLCVQNGIASFNPLEQESPFIRGWREKWGMDASGGSELAQYFIGGDFQREQGVYAINRQRQISLRSNVRGQLANNFDMTVNVGYSQNRLRLPQNDNNVRGVIPQGLLGNFEKDPTLQGWGFDTPQDIFAINTQQNVEHFTGSSRANWQPLSWLSAIGTAGLDFTNRIDEEFIPPYTASQFTSRFSDDSLGKRTSNPFQDFVYTANGGVTATFNPRADLRSATSGGVQYNDEITRATSAFGQGLLPGTSSLNGTTSIFTVGEANVENKTLGAYLQEQVAWRDKVFANAALRGDKNSAFGQNFKSVVYPAVSLSWVLGEESFFPRQDYLSSARFRTAYGESGQRPNFRDAILFFNPSAVALRTSDNTSINVPSFFTGGVGNQQLEPERSKEYEIGFDLGFLRDRIATELTYYSKSTTDALISRVLPPSNGQSTTRFENLGRVKNAGFEYQINAQLFEVRQAGFQLLLNGSRQANKLINLGQGIDPIRFNDSHQRHQDGYPLGGYWQVPILSYADKNGDGIISRINCPANNGTANPQKAGGPACEVQLGDTAVYLGSPFPSSEVSITPTLTVYKIATVRALFDHRGGQKLLNLNGHFRCVSFGICPEANTKNAPLGDQAAYIAGLMGTDAGYIQDASFTKLREVSVAFGVPQRLVSRYGFSGATLTFAGRNLHTWTKYKGLDPEINENGGANFSTDEFLSQPHVRYYTVRLDLGW
ncbi:MAG TPA: SusC/RagA family TonB-linked outer membrane protein [Gemmatimonadaceae bacterium]|nr:SusC/RagA family TonB-linked outer membrane protein [Gemmatimonadaceae bacterium]